MVDAHRVVNDAAALMYVGLVAAIAGEVALKLQLQLLLTRSAVPVGKNGRTRVKDPTNRRGRA
jgi:hypothetical protein